jgi:short-subunit dehydrogenase
MIRNHRVNPRICTKNFNNQWVVITGATSGIGFFAAHKYASQSANLLCINRNERKSEALRREIERDYSFQCDYRIADLSR